RAARAMAMTLPPHIQHFKIVFQESGLPLSSVTTRRSDLTNYQNDYDGAWRTLARAQIEGAGVPGQAPARFEYSISPYTALSLFDPQSPIRADVGPQLDISYRAAPGLTFAGRFRYPLAGNLGDSERESDSVLPRVRSEGFLYARESEFEVNRLTTEYLWRPSDETFARVTGGYLENMFGGVSAEVLWRPIESRFAWGAEVNYARQRDFDMLFGFQDYDVVTGHASAYVDLGNSYNARIDAGRYLAGDWGATVAVDREFNNGVRVGGFFTLTDVPFDDFGEGSFDKGIEIEFPLSYFTGKPSQLALSETLRPIQRDGGARLQVDNRLYQLTRDYGGPELSDGWGRYLR
ncbi:MAG: YjbH domain-containing protein, partial [Pseudomonadota bacterium]